MVRCRLRLHAARSGAPRRVERQMDRTAWRQLLIAVGISTVAIVVFLTIAYYAYRSDNVLGHGPLPSSASGGGAYAITILVALLAMLSAGVTCVGITQTREFTGRFFWVPYLLVEGILVLLLLVPLRRFGVDPWGGLPTFMASMPAQLMAGVTLGFLWVPHPERAAHPSGVAGPGGDRRRRGKRSSAVDARRHSRPSRTVHSQRMAGAIPYAGSGEAVRARVHGDGAPAAGHPAGAAGVSGQDDG